MLVYFIIYLAIIVLSFVLSFSLYPLLPSIDDPRLTKDVLSVLFSLGITGMILLGKPRYYKLHPLLSLLVFYSVFHCFIGPAFRFPLLNAEEDNIWQYRPIMYQLIFFSLFTVVSNIAWSPLRLRQLFSALSWMGLLTALYIFVQAAGFDQWLVMKATAEVRNTPSAEMTGTMRNVTFAAAFLVLVLPFVIESRKWISVAGILIAILLCKSQMAYGTVLIGLIWYGLFKFPLSRIKSAIICVLLFLGLFALPYIKFNDSGRFGIWKQIWIDVTHSQFEEGRNYFITGHGIGAYKYLFTSLHTTTELEPGVLQRAFEEAHNEPLEWFYNAGSVGLVFLIIIVFCLIKEVFPYTLQDERYLALTVSFISSVLLACGSFVWQIEPHRFITVVVAAILYNRIIKKEKERWEQKQLN